MGTRTFRNGIWSQPYLYTGVQQYRLYEAYGHIKSESHPRPYNKGWDRGGDFDLYKVESQKPITGYFFGKGYDGQLTPGFNTGLFLFSNIDLANETGGFAAVPLSVMNSIGTTAVARCVPTNPNFSLATFIGELREGAPRIVGSTLKDQTRNLRSKAGNEYLNVEFGWKPLISDLRKFATSVVNSRKIIDQYRRDSDRQIRRRWTYPETRTYRTSGPTGGFAWPTVANIACDTLCEEWYTGDYWFEGAFRYHVPVGDTQWDKIRRYESYANKLLGTRLTPEVLWNLAPWSWAVDWFTNTGDIMKNISLLGADGLVMRYGYMMSQQIMYQRITQTPISSTLYSTRPTVSAMRVKSTKQRVRANPYGFGITDTSLSARQLAVLAALGFSKSKS